MKNKSWNYIIGYLALTSMLIMGCTNSTIDPVNNNEECYFSGEVRCSDMIGAECINNTCECSENSYYIPSSLRDSSAKCLPLNAAFYVLDNMEGESKSFEHLKACRYGDSEDIRDSFVVNLYPTKIHGDRGALYNIPVRLVFDNVNANSGGGKLVGTTPVDFPVAPFHHGINIPDRNIAKIKWGAIFTVDSLVISAEFYDFYYDEPLNKSMRLVYKPFTQ